MKTLAMFPGQGSQFVGMGKDLLDQFPYTKEVFEEAEDSAKLQIRKLCFEGPESDLRLTANTQPSILALSVATWKVLVEEAGFVPDFFAGHSLGEYSALVAAGRISFARAAYLVRRRGEFMQSAVPEGVGAMAAVMKVDYKALEGFCKQVSVSGCRVDIANYNSPQQLVVAGHAEAVAKLSDVLATEKARVKALAVSAPFHSRLMTPAKDALRPLIEETEFQENGSKVFSNVLGSLGEYNKELLIRQVDAPVRWLQIMDSCKELEITRCVEVGPGKVLTGLAKRALAPDTVLLYSDPIEETISALS